MTMNLAPLAKVFLALSDKTRLRLLALMADGEVSVGFLAESLGESQPKTSRHLAYLRNCGLVSTRRDGKWIHYGIQPQRDEAADRILRTTIESIAPGTGSGMGRPAMSATEPVEKYGDVYEGEFRPNEIEVYLL